MKLFSTITKLWVYLLIVTLSPIFAKNSIVIHGIAQNPEGIAYDKSDHTFLLSSLNASPIIKVKPDGSYRAFTSTKKPPLSTAGLQLDYKHQRLLAAAFEDKALFDGDPHTKGISALDIYDLTTGKHKQRIILSSLAPDAKAYFANDVAVDDAGNAYITDWYANLIYKVDLSGKATLFWQNATGIKGAPNGIDFKDGSISVSLINVNEKGIYSDYALVKIPTNNPKAATIVKIKNKSFAGFDGMVVKQNGNIIGVTNDQKSAGGNTLIELSSKDEWRSATVIHKKEIAPSTTVAATENNESYVIHQDFSNDSAKRWKIEKVVFGK